MRRLNLTARRLAAASVSAPKKVLDNDAGANSVMLDARYLRQSSSLVQEALQKGFDVLQLANGDIITTGTKTVVHQYAWDDEKGKLVKAKPDARKSKRSSEDFESVSEEESVEDVMESEEA